MLIVAFSANSQVFTNGFRIDLVMRQSVDVRGAIERAIYSPRYEVAFEIAYIGMIHRHIRKA